MVDKTAPAANVWRSRIVGHGKESPEQLLANPLNWKIHPREQEAAVESIIDEVGVVKSVIVNQHTGYVLDGHLRVALAIRRGEPEVDVEYVDLTEEEEALAITVLDYTAGMSVPDPEKLTETLRSVNTEDDRIKLLLANLAEEAGLYKDDGDGSAGEGATPSLADRFVISPFSVLDARSGDWSARKKVWLSLGIKSEVGRGEDSDYTKKGLTYSNSSQPVSVYKEKNAIEKKLGRTLSWEEYFDLNPNPKSKHQHGTSVFDPVLTELAYRWFSPPDGTVLDPFAGGSVRGVVAGILGRRYTGIDLSQRQINANYENWREIAALVREVNTDVPIENEDYVTVKVSAKMARLPFNGCDPDYIRDVCHASCCQSSTSPTGTMITIHPSEVPVIEDRGGVVKDGLLQPRPGEKRCPFKTEDHLCGLHFTPDKPFGCIASPFTLNKNKTLIVRNRYRLLKCFDDGEKLPAYVAFRASLNLIFGEAEAQRICDHLEAGGGDLHAQMPVRSYRMLVENDAIKKGDDAGDDLDTYSIRDPQWLVGNSLNLDDLIDADTQYDYIFSCPPYYDLEVYSDADGDLSALGTYDEFIADYRAIIANAVKRLKDNRFACFVVGEIRDKKTGLYRSFVRDTIQAFEDAGAAFYNDAILVTNYGSLAIRIGGQFPNSRKLGKTHQNVLVFVKGDPKQATEACGDIEVSLPFEELENPDLDDAGFAPDTDV